MEKNKFPNSKIFLWCLLSFIISIALASFLPIFLLKSNFIWFLALAFVFVSLVITSKLKSLFIFCLLLFFAVLGFWRYSLGIEQKTNDKIWFYNESEVSFVGQVVDEPDKRAGGQKLKIKVSELLWQEKKLPVAGKVLVSVDGFLDFEYGDELTVTCALKTPEEFEGFKYDRYLARFDIYSVCYYPKIEKISGKQSPQLKKIVYKKIFALKNIIRTIINAGLAEPDAGLAKAIILGDKREVSEDLRVNFSRAGLSHIVAISGMHISILSAMFMGFLLYSGLKREQAFYLATGFLILYITLIGLPPSAMRAGMMGFLVLWALHLGRLNKLTNSLLLTAFILLMINPKLLRDDIGFQLSFLAVLGIAYVNPIIERFFDYLKIPRIFGLKEVFMLTLAAQVFTLPIIAINFGTVSLIAPIANLLVLWVLPLLMVTILGAIVLGGIFSYLALAWFLPAKIILVYIIFMATKVTELPFSYFYCEKVNIFLALLYYALCFLGIFLFERYREKS